MIQEGIGPSFDPMSGGGPMERDKLGKLLEKARPPFPYHSEERLYLQGNYVSWITLWGAENEYGPQKVMIFPLSKRVVLRKHGKLNDLVLKGGELQEVVEALND